MFAFALIFSSCQKNELEVLENPDDSINTNVPSDSVFGVIVNVKMEVGTIVYDSASTNITLTSWDKNNVAYEKEVSVNASNNKIYLKKTHQKFQFKFQKWGITKELIFTKDQIKEGDVINFGGKVNVKQLNSEESFMEAGGVTKPYSKVIYQYNEDGLIKQIDYFQAETSTDVLKFSFKMVYSYETGLLKKVDYSDAENKFFGTSTLTYNSNGKVASIQETKNGQTVNATFKYAITNNVENIMAEYTFDNGNKMSYTIKYKNGNIVEDVAIGASGAESGKYEYDSNINPYAQMNLYSLFLTNLSKNNNIKLDKVFSGSIPTNVPYKFEYKYDANGYPTEFEKSFKTYTSNAHLFKIKTLYKY